MNYSMLKYNVRKYKKGLCLEHDLEECSKSYKIYEYLYIKYPVLVSSLKNKAELGFNEKNFSVIVEFFCDLIGPDMAERFKSLINSEVNIVNQILRCETKWVYLDTHSFINTFNYNMKEIEQNLGNYSKVLFEDDEYKILDGVQIDLEESLKFYKKHKILLDELHDVIVLKKEMLEQIVALENIGNSMDFEILKMLAYELGALSNCVSLNFLVNNKSKVNIINSKIKTFMK